METDRFPSTVVRSHPERASYDFDTICDVLDSTYIAHLAVVQDQYPKVVPMMFVRRGAHVYLHARRGTELADDLAGSCPLSLAATVLDGIVLARRVRYHSLNYRSVVIYGRAEICSVAAEKKQMFAALLEKVWPGRTRGTTPASEAELAYVDVFRVPLDRASVKIRQGGPMEKPDLEDGLWTGHVDLRVVAGDSHPSHAGQGAPPPAWRHPQRPANEEEQS